MDIKLSHNREITEDYLIKDRFGFKDKAEVIKTLLENLPHEDLLNNNMWVLYGPWGSGKSSLLKHIHDSLNPIIYKPIFFNAWEHEKDQNLALSLCDAMTASIQDTTSQIAKDFRVAAWEFLKNFGKSISVKVPFSPLEFAVDKYIAHTEASLKKKDSIFLSISKFKESFQKLEKQILKATGEPHRIIVFVDDLDRCEPENVLNLISALKLFFTYGEKTMFFFGIDKQAVSQAVNVRYKDVVKADEYLEKVFDVSFTMPVADSLMEIIKASGIDFGNDPNDQKRKDVANLFKTLNFTNPRHIKKALNQYQLLQTYRQIDKFDSILPRAFNELNRTDLIEGILCLFFIVLREFYPEYFAKVRDYIRIIANEVSEQDADTKVLIDNLTIPLNDKLSLTGFLSNGKKNVITYFQVSNFKKYHWKAMSEEKAYFVSGDLIIGDNVLSKFAKFINFYSETYEKAQSQYYFVNYFKMVDLLL